MHIKREACVFLLGFEAFFGGRALHSLFLFDLAASREPDVRVLAIQIIRVVLECIGRRESPDSINSDLISQRVFALARGRAQVQSRRRGRGRSLGSVDRSSMIDRSQLVEAHVRAAPERR